MAPFLVALVVYAVIADPWLPIVDLELAGDASTAAGVVGDRAEAFRSALIADWVAFIPGYVATIALAATRWHRLWLTRLIVLLVVVAGAADIAENTYLWRGLDSWSDTDFAAARTFAIIKFALLIPALVLALIALVRPLSRGRST